MEPKQINMDWNQFPCSNRAARDERRIALLDQVMASEPMPSTSQAQNTDLISRTSQPTNTFLLKQQLPKPNPNLNR